MNRQRPMIVALALALAAALAAGASQAHARSDVQWTVTIGSPAVVLPHVVLPPPPLPHVRVQPVVVAPRAGYREPTRWDADGDGIPNRYDRVYNPRWDVDGDGIPNRYDRRDGYDRYHGASRHDRDHDGIPNRRDPFPNRPQGGWGR